MSNIKLPVIFQENMVLQREKPVKVWGEAPVETGLTVSLDGIQVSCKSGKDGHFFCELPAQKAGTRKEFSVWIEGEKEPELYFSNVSIGDVWIAAGQSNMEFFLRYDKDWQDTQKLPFNPEIHMFNCPQTAFEGQERDFSASGYWFQEQDYAWGNFSAPGYSFARNIQPVLGVPVGIIGCNWGGTPARAWVAEEYLKNDPELEFYLREYQEAQEGKTPGEIEEESRRFWEREDSYGSQMEFRAVLYGLNWEEQVEWVKQHKDIKELVMGPYHHYRPCGLYEHMLKKIAPFSAKGVLWYQGESDADHGELYQKMFSTLIRCWRDTWKDELPFLFVQLAPFERWLECTGDGYPEVRKSQDAVAHTVKGTAMTSIMDLGMHDDIHPKQKMEVGRRLALLARGKVYGEDLLCEPPEFTKAERNGNALTLHFIHTGETLTLKGDRLNALTITQAGRPCEASQVTVKGDQIQLQLKNAAPDVSIEVSFAWSNYCEVNVFNEAGIPVKPFRCTI